MSDVVQGEGYAVGHLDDLGEGPGFRKVRGPLGVTEFGVNAIVYPPGLEPAMHGHERQQELYFVHAGRVAFEFGDGARHEVGPGGLARVDPATLRRVVPLGDEPATVLVVGAAGGYVGRDGFPG